MPGHRWAAGRSRPDGASDGPNLERCRGPRALTAPLIGSPARTPREKAPCSLIPPCSALSGAAPDATHGIIAGSWDDCTFSEARGARCCQEYTTLLADCVAFWSGLPST